MPKAYSIILLLLCCFSTAAGEAQLTLATLFDDLSSRSHPPRYELRSLMNPWGEAVLVHNELPDRFGLWIVTAARVYASQGIRFDGYLGSEDDGRHYDSAADGEDMAYVGSLEIEGYIERKDGVPDDLLERSWICLDLPVHAITLAGYPLRRAMLEDYAAAPEAYSIDGTFLENRPETSFFFRRIRNLRTYFTRNHLYVETRITAAQYRDPLFHPTSRYLPGDVAFFGHYGDPIGTGGEWHPKHSGIVARVDKRGLPTTIYNMRVSRDLIDQYEGEINQLRKVNGEDKLFKRFSDRYSLIGFGRIIRPYIDEDVTPNHK